MFVKVNTRVNSKKEYVKKVGENRLEVAVREKAERNMANKRVIELVALHFGLSIKQIRIINGHQSPSKMLSVDND